MTDYIDLWFENLKRRTPKILACELRAIGIYKRNVGPISRFAKVEIRVIPAEDFEVVDNTAGNVEHSSGGYSSWAVFGLLDVLLTAWDAPMRNVRVVLENMEITFESSNMAFLNAGRDAGKKIVALAKEAEQRAVEVIRNRNKILK